ncbi:hypothetical protein CXB51_036902 [Gossypium anomalum]|uniref:Uncharacterized protein n=1 Tax=Gossypium anomalum TaxID=47600 RepID=A0A8J5XVP3_9ROSI|nr:hypothetical protein CXB51_036902 [Gossypium anomalum]
MKQPECNKGEGEGEDTELKEDDISQDSNCFSGLSNYGKAKKWRYVCLRKTCQRNEQVALLLKVFKCDKFEIPSIYEFRNVYHFHAYLTLDEAENLSGEVEDIDWLSMSEVASKAKRTRHKLYIMLAGSILSHQRQNKEKWRYNEDFEPEPESDIKDLEEEDLPEDDSIDDYDDPCRDSCRYEGYSCREGYYGFDASGKRIVLACYTLKSASLDRDSCKSIYSYKANHLFEARMSEEEADKVAGLEEVEYMEPRRYIKIRDLN